jgi:hypothetical protein
MAERKDDGTQRAKPAGRPPKKQYAAPKLRVYGDVAAITRTVGNTGTVLDGGHGSMSKTS